MNPLWFLKIFRAKANVTRSRFRLEGLFVLLMIDSAHKQTNRRRLADEQKSGEEEIRIYAAAA
jgi:hypothetical protein